MIFVLGPVNVSSKWRKWTQFRERCLKREELGMLEFIYSYIYQIAYSPIMFSFSSVQFNLVTQLCLTLRNPMNYSKPGLPVHHQLLEFTQTHVRWVGDGHPTISSSVTPFSCLQSCPASESFQMSQFFAWGGRSIGVSSFSISPSTECSGLISFRVDQLGLLAVQGTLESSPTPQFKSIISSALSFLYSPTLTSIHNY